jgi:hypothetical protein
MKSCYCHHFYTREGERFLFCSPSYIGEVVTGQYLQGFSGDFSMVTGMVTDKNGLIGKKITRDEK